MIHCYHAYMALIRRNGIFYVRFSCRGKDTWRSTGHREKRKAAVEAARIIEGARSQNTTDNAFKVFLGTLEALPDLNERDKARRVYAGELLQGLHDKLPLSDCWGIWSASPNRGRRATIKPSTLTGYESMWRRFEAWLAKRHKRTRYLHEISPAIVDAYSADLHGTGITARTYNSHIKFLRSLFKTLAVRGGLQSNPWDHLRGLQLETESKREFTSKELKTICSKAAGDLRYWFCIGIYSGLRLADVVSLKWSEIDFDTQHIQRVPSKTSAGRKPVRIPLHPVLNAMLSELRETSKGEYLFPQAAKRHRRDRSATSKLVQDFLRNDCGIETREKANGQRQRAVSKVGFHSLRHSFVSLCASNHVPEPAIRALVGHGSPAMTRLYSHADDGDKQRAVKLLPEGLFT